MNPPAATYLVAGCRPWNRGGFERNRESAPGDWRFVSAREELTTVLIDEVRPRYIFFLHWSWFVPETIYIPYECVCFLMADVPYGRGGSPLQNLIARGHRETKLTALRMVEEMDAGPIYRQEPLSLEGGTAEEIFIRASDLSMQMAVDISRSQPEPRPQVGESMAFMRRRPEQSTIGGQSELTQLHDFIRMLDADGYPRAFIEHDGFRYTFRRAARYNGRIEADVTITPIEGDV
jgi:methionyl-tRNA formyltransferase